MKLKLTHRSLPLIVSFRNNFNKLIETAYSSRNADWQIGIQRFYSERFGEILSLHVVKDNEQPTTPENHRMIYWGRQYERCCTDDTIEGEFCSLVLSQLNEHRIIIAGEVDGTKATRTSATQTTQQPKRISHEHAETTHFSCEYSSARGFIELKTARDPEELSDSQSSFAFWKLR